MAAYGLYSHIQSNRRRSIALLIALFFLIYVLVYAGALVGEALTVNADLDILMQRAWRDLISAAPAVRPLRGLPRSQGQRQLPAIAIGAERHREQDRRGPPLLQ